MTSDPSDVTSNLMTPLKSHVIVLFGATGDLARRKLLPGLLHLHLHRGGAAGVGHRDVHRPALPDRQLALGRRTFFLRIGKRLAECAQVISIAIREPPKSMFPANSGVGAQGPEHLTFDLADASKLSLSFSGKRPGPGIEAMSGDHTLLTTAEGVERLWEVSMPLLNSPPPVRSYPPGSWGPNAIHQLVALHAWRLPFERAWRDVRVG